jgi:Family of unknown function (DUF6527)
MPYARVERWFAQYTDVVGIKVIESRDRDGNHYSWLWHCPACDAVHQCDKRWTFNGDLEKPTFRNSVLVHEVKGENGQIIHPRCHSYVTDGHITFLADSTHASVGKTLQLRDWDEMHPDPFHAGSFIHTPKKP